MLTLWVTVWDSRSPPGILKKTPHHLKSGGAFLIEATLIKINLSPYYSLITSGINRKSPMTQKVVGFFA
jgi:hypothetical protein